jgi:Lar family restriction alleviation protein
VTSDALALLPCPFCGGSPDLRRLYASAGVDARLFVECKGCGAYVESPDPGHENVEAVAGAWNRRKAASEDWTYVVVGKTLAGGAEIVYAGPDSDRAQEEMRGAARTDRFRRFDFQRWMAGDVDGDFYGPDGRPEP